MTLPTPVWSGSFTVFGVEVKCHVLDSGARIIEEDSVVALLDAMSGSGPSDGDGMAELLTFCTTGKTP